MENEARTDCNGTIWTDEYVAIKRKTKQNVMVSNGNTNLSKT